MATDFSKVKVINYPDPRLRTLGIPVKRFDSDLFALAKRMLELMREHKGVGLAAPQVGLAMRMFVMNATDDPANDRIVINPELLDLEGAKESEEGCLSIPEVRVQVRRALRCRLKALDVEGKPFELAGEDFIARIWQHETDHLNGVLIIDRMGPGDKIATKKHLKDLEAAFAPKAVRKR